MAKSKQTKKLTVDNRLDALSLGLKTLTKITRALTERVSNLESLNQPTEESPPKPKPKHLGRGVERISRGNLENGNVGKDQIITEKGTVQILPKVQPGL